MNFFRHIIPVSFMLLLIMNVYAFSLITNVSSSHEILDHSGAKKANPNTKSSNHVPRQKVGTEITSGKTNLTTDKDNYAPGEWATITVDSTTDEMNGSLEWQLESPIGEVAFDFYSGFQDIFTDRTFDSTTVLDWTNASFDFVETPLDYLNLTEVPDLDKDDVEIYFNATALDSATYRISFDHLSQTQNLLQNASFENGYTGGWEFNSSHVTPINDPKNASKGSYYMRINGTEGYKLSQNVSFTGNRYVTFSARATGVTGENYWYITLEAYNSTHHIQDSISSSNSLDATPDEKGYAFGTIKDWPTPVNTTYIRAVFYGQDSGGDGNYTGWLDDCYLAEVAPDLLFSYSDGTNWENVTVTAGNHEWESTSFDIDLVKNTSKTFRFILPDDNSFPNNATSYWLIDNIAVNLITISKNIMGPITNKKYEKVGFINSTWFHQGFHENISSTFDVEVEEPENTTVPSECQAIIRVQLPSHQVYFGSWIFMFVIHPVDAQLQELPEVNAINISFIIEEPMNYVIQDIYMLRGSTNVTQGNDSIFTEYFEQETNIQVISPGDNVTLLGYLEANSTQGEWYDLEYLQVEISSASVEYQWNSNWQSRENITWEVFGFFPYDREGETILDGNFSSPFDNTSTMALNFRIPNRGIFGNLSANLTLTLTGANVKNGVGGEPLIITIPLDLPPVKFKAKIINENLPATSYYITDYIDGNITLEFRNFNDTLESNFQDRNISSRLSIPMKDLELTIFLDNMNQTPDEVEISQQIHYHYINTTVLWLDPVAPRLLPGTYAFRIRWNSPYKLIITHYIEIKGNLEIIPPEELPIIQQGGQKTINFSVQIIELNRIVGGLDLIGIVSGNQTYGNLIVYEEEGKYKIDLDIELDMEADNYTISIFIVEQADAIGEITYQVTERPVTPTDTATPMDLVINIGGFAFFIIVSVVLIGALYWANKSMK